MKAAVFYGPHQELKIEEVETPKIGAGEILVKVAGCGVCHTDLHYIDHGVPTFKKPPLILGHEASGIISEIGEGVRNFKIGDRVLLPAVYSCGSCFFCRTGRENICQTMIMFGNHVDGAYAEYIKAPAKDTFLLPEEIPLVEGSIIADAISTPYHALKNRAELRAGDSIVVFGCGGVGINVVQIAYAMGGKVIAVDVVNQKLELAKKIGASVVLNAKEVDVKKEVRKFTGGGADVAIEAIGNSSTMELAFDCLRKGGKLVIIGYCDKVMSLNVSKVMFFEMEIMGSLGCRGVDYPKLIEMVKIGKIQVAPLVSEKFPLEKVNDAFESLRRGEVIRNVIIP